MATIPYDPSTPEGHNEAMLEVAEQGSVEGVQKVLSKDSEENTEENTEESQEETQEESTEETEESQEESTEEAPVLNTIIEECSTEYMEQGALSEDSYTKLAEAGLPREMVDAYIKGVEAQQQEAMQPLYDIVGGAEEMESLMEWCGSNLEPDSIEEYNELLTSPSLRIRTMAVKELKELHDAKTSHKPKLLKGGLRSPVSTPAYKSWAEVQQDMANPKYKTDEAFRAKVERRLAKSSL